MGQATVAMISAMLCGPTLLHAQTSLFIGAHAVGASFASPSARTTDAPIGFSPGVGAHAELALGNAFGILFILDNTVRRDQAGDTDLGQWDALGRFPSISVGAARTYLTAGLSRNRASTGGDVSPTAGLTGRLPATSRLAIDAGLLWTLGRFKTSDQKTSQFVGRVFFGASYAVFGHR